MSSINFIFGMRLSVLIIGFMLYFSNGIAQIEWAPIGTKWYYSKAESMGGHRQGYIVIESKRDTMVGGKNAKLLEVVLYSSYNKIEKWENEYSYAENGVVYYWRNNKYYILYDFMATKDSTWTIFGIKNYCTIDTGIVMVDSVSKITIFGNSLKCLHTKRIDTSNWRLLYQTIEYIGNLLYLFPIPYCWFDDLGGRTGYGLRCYYNPKYGFYKRTSLSCDTLISTGINNDNNDNQDNIISFKAGIKTIFINLEKYENVECELHIIDIYGKVILTKYPILSSENYNLSNLNSGIYIIRVTLHHKTNPFFINQKILIQ